MLQMSQRESQYHNIVSLTLVQQDCHMVWFGDVSVLVLGNVSVPIQGEILVPVPGPGRRLGPVPGPAPREADLVVCTLS